LELSISAESTKTISLVVIVSFMSSLFCAHAATDSSACA
jgi:hypothetical protein